MWWCGIRNRNKKFPDHILQSLYTVTFDIQNFWHLDSQAVPVSCSDRTLEWGETSDDSSGQQLLALGLRWNLDLRARPGPGSCSRPRAARSGAGEGPGTRTAVSATTASATTTTTATAAATTPSWATGSAPRAVSATATATASASTSTSTSTTAIGTWRTAARLGAAGVNLHADVGHISLKENIMRKKNKLVLMSTVGEGFRTLQHVLQ